MNYVKTNYFDASNCQFYEYFTELPPSLFSLLLIQMFEFDLPWEQIRDCALDIAVMDFDTIGRNEMIGKLMIGCEYPIAIHTQK